MSLTTLRFNQVRVTQDAVFSNKRIINLGNGVAANDAVTLGQLQAAVQGLSWKNPVRLATSQDISLTGLQTIDGVTVAVGDRVLVKAQADARANGIYLASAAAWTRADDADGSSKLAGAATLVMEGATHKDSQWVLTNDLPIVIGADELVFIQFSGAGQLDAGAGLTKTGNRLDVGAGDGIEVGADSVGVKLAGTTLFVDGTGLKVNASGITETEIAASTLGNGLEGGAGTKVAVKTTGTTLANDPSGLRVATGGITAAELHGSVVGHGLQGAAGQPLAIKAADGTLAVGLDGIRLAGLPEGFVLRGGTDGTATPAREVRREAPVDTGDHLVYQLAFAPIPGTEEVYLNGVLQEPGVGNDYALSGAVLTFASANLAEDRVRVSYQANS